MPRETVSEFPLGIGASPGHGGGSFKSAADMLNIDIDKIGRPESRLGYVHDNTPVLGNGNRIAKLHYVGNSERDSVSRLFRFHDNESWVNHNGRVIISGEGFSNRWVDMETMKTYDWINNPPHVAPLKIEGTQTYVIPDNIIEHRRDYGIHTNIITAYNEAKQISDGVSRTG